MILLKQVCNLHMTIFMKFQKYPPSLHATRIFLLSLSKETGPILICTNICPLYKPVERIRWSNVKTVFQTAFITHDHLIRCNAAMITIINKCLLLVSCQHGSLLWQRYLPEELYMSTSIDADDRALYKRKLSILLGMFDRTASLIS